MKLLDAIGKNLSLYQEMTQARVPYDFLKKQEKEVLLQFCKKVNQMHMGEIIAALQSEAIVYLIKDSVFLSFLLKLNCEDKIDTDRLGEQYVRLYHKLYALKYDERMKIVRELVGKECISQHISEESLDKITEKFLQKPLSQWIYGELEHVENLSWHCAIRILEVWEELERFIPGAKSEQHLLFLLKNRERLKAYPDFESVMKQVTEIDTTWKKLCQQLKIEPSFAEENQKGVRKFLYQGGAEIIGLFLQNSEGEKEKIRRLCLAEIADRFYDVKYHEGDLEHEIALEISKENEVAWRENLVTKNGNVKLWEEDRLLPVMQIGELVGHVRECQTHRRKEDFLLLDPMCGSGTSGDVAADLGIQCVQYDLNPELPCGLGGWNALKDDVEDSADLVFLHPPYHSIIRCSGNMWGKPHADDLSRCDNYADFIEKLNHVIKKLFFSLRSGGVLALLVGDIRQNGEFHSIANDVMTIGTMKSWIVKAQFSCSSSSRSYHSRHPLIPIVTEHLLLFQKENVFQIPYSFRKSGFFYLQKQDSKALTWFHLVCAVMEHLGGIVTLSQLYEELKDHPKAVNNKHYKERIRATLYEHRNEFLTNHRGSYRLSYM